MIPQGTFEFKEISEVNIVPLADVSLCLLIILMVISPMMTQEMLRVQAAAESRQALPPRDPSEVPSPPELVLVVSLLPNGLAVGDRQFEGVGAFLGFMNQTLASRQDKKVFVAPHPDVENGRVVLMLEMLKNCGASSVALVQSQPPPSPVEGSR